MLKQKFVSQSTPFLAPILTYFLLIFWHHGIITVAQSKSTTRIGAIINVDSRIGKEVITAMEMAVQSSNSISVDHMFSLHYRHPGSNPLQTAHAEPEAQKAWMFLRPFTKEMWVFTSAILFYTVFIVWLLERQSNPEFEGPWRNQLATALWFTYSSLFFTQRERVHSNYTRVVVLVWLFVVLALNSSYTANLSSMLTVSRLESSVTNVEWLRRNNAKVGCDADSFIGDYLVNNLKFKMDNLKKIHSEYDYPSKLQTSNITAAFLELPYEKAFLLENCNGYIATELPDRFGGFGFVFQKDSPIAASVSEAILTLSENEKLKQLEAQWFTPSKECLASQTTITNDNLNWQSFWGLYAFSGITSTICCLLFFIHRFYQRRHQVKEGYSTTNHEDLSIELVKLVDDQLDGHSNMATNNQLLEPVVISDVSSYRNPHLS